VGEPPASGGRRSLLRVTDDVTRSRDGFVEPEIYYAGLAAAFVTAGALITDPGGRVLLVKPNYRDHWLFPGGTADDNESPEAACARELKEEIGLALPVGRLLLVDWRPARAERPRPTVGFIFDAGILERPERIRLQEDELDDHAFFEPGEAAARLGPVGDRLPVALRARTSKSLLYMSET
jgi:8-oxo-dGTP diphosphatase